MFKPDAFRPLTASCNLHFVLHLFLSLPVWSLIRVHLIMKFTWPVLILRFVMYLGPASYQDKTRKDSFLLDSKNTLVSQHWLLEAGVQPVTNQLFNRIRNNSYRIEIIFVNIWKNICMEFYKYWNIGNSISTPISGLKWCYLAEDYILMIFSW